MAAILDAILNFEKTDKEDSRGLLVSDSTHIHGPLLKKSACSELCPPFGLYELMLLAYLSSRLSNT